MSPAMRRIAFCTTRCAVIVAPVMIAVLVGVALAYIFFEVGNYAEPRHRQAVGAFFLFLFLPVTGDIGFFARHRRRVLRAVMAEEGKS